jgi:hypothetical protein
MSILNIVLDETKNRGGIIMLAGNTKNAQNYSNITSVRSANKLEKRSIGSTVVENEDVTKAVDDYTFGYSFRPLVKGATKLINSGSLYHGLFIRGHADTSLTTGIHQIWWNYNRLDTYAIRNNQYSLITNKFEDGYPVVSEDIFFTDYAASVNRTDPGTISFKIPRSTVSRSYKPKNG